MFFGGGLGFTSAEEEDSQYDDYGCSSHRTDYGAGNGAAAYMAVLCFGGRGTGCCGVATAPGFIEESCDLVGAETGRRCDVGTSP